MSQTHVLEVHGEYLCGYYSSNHNSPLGSTVLFLKGTDFTYYLQGEAPLNSRPTCLLFYNNEIYLSGVYQSREPVSFIRKRDKAEYFTLPATDDDFQSFVLKANATGASLVLNSVGRDSSLIIQTIKPDANGGGGNGNGGLILVGSFCNKGCLCIQPGCHKFPCADISTGFLWHNRLRLIKCQGQCTIFEAAVIDNDMYIAGSYTDSTSIGDKMVTGDGLFLATFPAGKNMLTLKTWEGNAFVIKLQNINDLLYLIVEGSSRDLGLDKSGRAMIVLNKAGEILEMDTITAGGCVVGITEGNDDEGWIISLWKDDKLLTVTKEINHSPVVSAMGNMGTTDTMRDMGDMGTVSDVGDMGGTGTVGDVDNVSAIRGAQSIFTVDGLKHFIVEGTNIRVIKNKKVCEIPVEQLRPGTKIISRDSSYIVQKVYHHNLPSKNYPYKINVNQFGPNMPYKETLISEGYRAIYPRKYAQSHNNRKLHQEIKECTKYSIVVHGNQQYSLYANGLLIQPI